MLLTRRQFSNTWLGKWGSRFHRRGTVARSAVKSNTKQLLDSFWAARGVLDVAHRKRLVDAAEALEAEEVNPWKSVPLSASAPLPGLPATWQLEESTPEVLAASRRLLALQQMLGGGGGGGNGAGALGYASSSLGGGGGGGGSSGGARSGGGGGGGAVDVVWMVVREPGLLSADLAQLTGRLLEMKLATYGTDVDVLKVIEAQPALLLSDRWRLDLESLQAADDVRQPASASAAERTSTSAPAAAESEPLYGAAIQPAATSSSAVAAMPGSGSRAATGSRSSGAAPAVGRSSAQLPVVADGAAASSSASSSGRGDESVQQLVEAWQYGLASDGDQEWAIRMSQLCAYAGRHGDTCVGFREGDDPDLARWATKQRADWRRGGLAEGRLHQLSALGFHFDADEADWSRWFAELMHFKTSTGHASPMPLVTGADMYLINWCSVQRIARRSRVLSESRIQRLEDAGFDWTGADPLS